MARTRKLSPQLILGMSAPEYHSDPAPKPSLSASLAHKIVAKSERHAFDAHPRLNPDFVQQATTDPMDDGSSLHTMFLGTGTEIVPVGSPDWKAEWARDKRDRARREGKIAVLQRRIPQLQACADAVRSELQANDVVRAELFGKGNAEVVIMARLGPNKTWCRTRIDWLPDDPRAYVYDLKFTTGSAAPADWERNVWSEYDVQEAMICDLVEAQRGVRPPGVRFVVAEMQKPYGASILQAAPDVMERGRQRLEDAIERWDRAISAKVWPGYRRVVAVVGLPGWMLEQVQDRAYAREKTPRKVPHDPPAPHEAWERITA